MHSTVKIARGFQILVGFVYLIAGILKTWEPILFYWEAIPFTQMLGFGQESFKSVAKMAVILAPIEIGLGASLILNWQHRIILPVSTLLMGFFTALLVYAWHIGASIDCGCFGAVVERSPGEAAAEDAVMFFMLAYSTIRLRSVTQIPWIPRLEQNNTAIIAIFVVSFVVCGIRFFPESDRIDKGDLKSGLQLVGLNLQGTDIDINEGKYLLELFSPTCGYCIDAVPKLNAIASDSSLPKLIALTNYKQESEQVREFKDRYSPSFDIATISLTDFYRLTYSHGYPRLAYVDGGIVQTVWERDFMPDVSRLRQLISR